MCFYRVPIYTRSRWQIIGLCATFTSLVSVLLRQLGQWRNHFEVFDIGIAK